tara:strand:- start:470 stop:901 length:432 start_codon:yes stop_codon:yes gene_type:complete
MQTQINTDTVSSRQSQMVNNWILDDINSNQKKLCVDHINCKNTHDKKGVDVESNLLGLGQFLNRLPPEQHQIQKECKPKTVTFEDKDDIYWDHFNQETRTKKSCDVLSGVTIDRFEYQHVDLQEPHLKQMKSIDSRLLHKYKI